ncbi:MAG: hypothetical protein ACREF3_12610 [Acetobacteraceae bacterium]
MPAEVRRQLGLNPGNSVVPDVPDRELRVRSVRRTVEWVPALVRCIPEDASLSEESIAQRRAATGREGWGSRAGCLGTACASAG